MGWGVSCKVERCERGAVTACFNMRWWPRHASFWILKIKQTRRLLGIDEGLGQQLRESTAGSVT